MTQARDGDILDASIDGNFDIEFADATALVAIWPLSSDAQLSIDGMLAAQVTTRDITAATLAPNDAQILAMDLIVPGNGYADDVLDGFRIVNLGSADDNDLASVQLWRDGGDGQFTPGSGDDANLGPLVWTGGEWQSPVLSETLPAVGTRFFVGVSVSATPTDSATVQFSVPLNGLIVTSGNDGPIDRPVDCRQSLLLSVSPLIATLDAAPTVSTVGQSVTVNMIVRNVGTEQINNITPSGLTITGDGDLTVASGVQPPALDLPPAAVDTLSWTYTSTVPGTARWVGNCQGTGAISGMSRTSPAATSNPHQVFDQAGDLDLYPVESMPFLISRGQGDVIPLSLTFSASGGSSSSDVRVTGFKLRLEDDQGSGIVPADLLSRVTVSEGNTTYLVKSALEASGSEVDLTLATPAVVPTVEQATLAIRLDISPTTVVPNFKVVIQDSSWLVAEDAISSAPVNVSLQQGSYPVQSGLGRLVVSPTRLDVQSVQSGARRVGWGQSDAALMTVQVDNPGVMGLTADIAVARMGVSLTDTTGVVIPDADRFFDRIRVRGPTGILVDRSLGAQDSTAVMLTLSPLANVPVNTPLNLTVSADIASTADVGGYRLQLVDAANIDARDSNTGATVPAVYASNPVAGDTFIVEAPAESLMAASNAAFPQSLTVGEIDVIALAAVLRHPSPVGVASIRITDLTFQCQNETRNPLVPGAYIDRLRVMSGPITLADITNIPGSGNTIVAPFADVMLAPGDSLHLEVRVDISASAPQAFLELLVDGPDVHAEDANLSTSVIVSAETGSPIPMTSGLTQLLPPATELVVDLGSLMPAVLGAGSSDLPVAGVTLTNTAAPNSGPINLDHLVVRSTDQSLTPQAIGLVAERVKIYQGATLLGESGSLTGDSATAYVPFPALLSVQPQQPVELQIRVDLHASVNAQNFRVGIAAEDVGIIQPSSALLRVSAEPPPGRVFPQWTDVGNFAVLTLRGSFSNYPNPFAAGSQSTTFVYYLPKDGAVSLKIWTPRGESVTTLRQNESRPAGLYQDDLWNGRNGRGTAVLNGVYIAELTVRYYDGTSDRLLRKVAVVR
jgi:hypothetical protein